MPSLYSSLFHAGSLERDRLEDFLTEALADFLNRLPDEDKIEFCVGCFLSEASPEHQRLWIDLAKQAKSLTWKSQGWIAVSGLQKRPDLILYCRPSGRRSAHHSDANQALSEERPLMIVECKINAQFSVDQLSYYDKWLMSRADGAIAALVVLTHTTEPPDDFLLDGSKYLSPMRAVTYWPRLYRYLTDLSAPSEAIALLRAELLNFMREKKLMTDEPTLQDAASARLFLASGAHRRLAAFMTSARNAVRSKFGNLKGWPDRPPFLVSEQDDECGALEDWCEFHKKVYVGWGIVFGTGSWSEHMEPPMPRSDGVAVWIEFGERRVTRPGKDKFKDWHFPTESENEEFYVGKMLDFDQVDPPTARFSSWLTSCLTEAKEIIDEVVK